MKLAQAIRKLRQNRKTFESFLESFSSDEVLFKPANGKWNMLEVVCHLLDEERLDFRARIRHILESPNAELPKIDPEGWVEKHGYATRDYKLTVEDFLVERDMSLEWLETLDDDVLDTQFMHPVFGNVTARYFLMNWIAHDYLHFRQINKNIYTILKNKCEEDLRYAGDW